MLSSIAMPVHSSSWRRRAARTALILALTAGLAPCAIGAVKPKPARTQASTGTERNTLRLQRQTPSDQAEPAKAAETEPDKQPWYIEFGVSRDSDSAGHSVSTPFLISWSSDRWYLEVSGDGYLDAAGEGTRHRGLSDVALVLSYTYNFGKGYALTPEVELDLPSHGAVGSTRASQALRLELSRTADKWGWAVAIRAARSGDTEPDVSRYARSASLKLHYDLGPGTTSSLKLTRRLQAGAAASNSLTWGLGFPLPTGMDKAGKGSQVWSGTVSLSRERSAGASSHGIEFDIGCAF